MGHIPIRVIARLDIKGPNLVKGIHLEGLRALGRPEEFAEFYYRQGIDELFYMDVVASLYERNSLADFISAVAKKVFIPMTVGGGIRTIDDINHVLRAGADKVCINTAAIRNPEFIKQAVKKFGSSTIVVAIEAIRQQNGEYLAFIDNGREYTGIEVIGWAEKLNSMGVGEIVITSVDREGTGSGFDLELVKKITAAVNIPVIAHGGCGSIKDVIELFNKTQASAVALASILHYYFINQIQNSTENPPEGNFTFLKSKNNYSKINSCDLKDLKLALSQEEILCRV
jgi:imidazole glycerol-phosphate synthase subunit HisF